MHDGDEPVFGVLGYRNDSFDRASGNLGDSIQTLAALNCYRRVIQPGMPFREFLERVLTDTVPGARFVIVERDGSWRQSFPRRVVTLMNGWFMSADADDALEWPPHEAIDPIFVSFHVADDRLLSPAGVAYLQRFAPIGCRDQATVEKLVAHGIEAYLSGCLTLTIDFLRWLGGGREDLFVDVAREGRATLKHWSAALKNREPGFCLRTAYRALMRYALARSVTTSRLHCFLPCVAMGVPVTLADANLQDPRFRGVDGWDYAILRERLIDDVAARLGRLVSPPPAPPPPCYDVCFCVDEHVAPFLPVVVHSIVHANRHARIRVHAVCPEGVVVPRLDGVEVLAYRCSRGQLRPGPEHATNATMLRLQLPDLVREDIRIVVLDVALVVAMNLAPMVAFDPGPTGIAMRSSMLTGDALARSLGVDRAELTGCDESRFGNTGVMLLDLPTLRRDGFTRFCRDHPQARNDELLINRYCRGRHGELPREWNLFVDQDADVIPHAEEHILHYVGPRKPWTEPRADRWQVWNWYERRMQEQHRA